MRETKGERGELMSDHKCPFCGEPDYACDCDEEEEEDYGEDEDEE